MIGIEWMGKQIEDCDKDQLLKFIEYTKNGMDRLQVISEGQTICDLRHELKIKDEIIDRFIGGRREGN